MEKNDLLALLHRRLLGMDAYLAVGLTSSHTGDLRHQRARYVAGIGPRGEDYGDPLDIWPCCTFFTLGRKMYPYDSTPVSAYYFQSDNIWKWARQQAWESAYRYVRWLRLVIADAETMED